MSNSSSVFDLILLWLCLAASVFLVVVAVRARRVERDQGLARSPYRLLASLAVCVLVALFVGLGTASILRPASAGKTSASTNPGASGKATTSAPSSQAAVKPGPNEEQIARLKRDREELEKKIKALQDEIAKLEPPVGADSSTNKLADGADPAKPAAPGWFDFGMAARLLVPFLVFGGLVLLLVLGDPGVLRLALMRRKQARTELQQKAQAELDTLIAAVEQGRYRDALETANRMNVNVLERFERMDWAFLKSYCAVQVGATAEVPNDERRSLLESAVTSLTGLLEDAPNRGEAVYLLAIASGLLGESQRALDAFERAKGMLSPPTSLPFDHNESVCLLSLAEEKLSQGDTEGSGKLFDRVTGLKVLVDVIPASLVKVRLHNVRRNLQANQLNEATAGLEIIRKLEGLDEAQKHDVAVMCDALSTIITARGGDDVLLARQVKEFLDRHIPANLPEPDEQIADEYLDKPLAGIELRLAPELYRAFFFLQAEVAARTMARQGVLLTPAQVAEIARPLFRALQFELRQRDVLAALGGLYFWFVPEKKAKAQQWLEAAVDMGAESQIARRILDRARQVEMENRDTLDWFRSTAGRFLHDSTVRANVRQALVEELGRFQGFRTMLLDLDSDTDLEPKEATLTLLRERAVYMEKMVAELATRKPDTITADLEQLRSDYARLLGSIDASTGQMAEIEKRLIQEIGKTVLT